MEKIIFLAVVVTFLFCIVKFLEIKFLEEKMRPLKEFVRDAAIVFASSLTGGYLAFSLDKTLTQFFNIVTDNKTLDPTSTQIFTDVPGF